MWNLALAFFIFSSAGRQDSPAPVQSTCVRCHAEFAPELVKDFAQDIHSQNGLSCHDCHGGDPTLGIEKGGPYDSMDKAKGYTGRPARERIPRLCSSCHSSIDYMRKFNPQARVDQYGEYLTSVHGMRLVKGDTKVATCIDCHGIHNIRAVTDPNSSVYPTRVAATCGGCHADPGRMSAYGIPTDQLALYSKSVHGDAINRKRDLSAPTCNDCHGNHGAVPPGVDSAANVCGQCHASQWDLFDQSPHKAAFAAAGLPACLACHGHHDVMPTSDAMLGTEKTAACATCHDPGTKGYLAAVDMKAGISGLERRLEAARAVLERAERAGMEVSKPLYDLVEGRDRLVRARVEVHRFDPAILHKTLDEGSVIAESARNDGVEALEELAYRRRGLAVSALILLSMIGLLILKIRQRKEENDRGTVG